MSALYLVLAFLLGIVLTLVVSHIRKPDGVMEVTEQDEKMLYQLVLFSEIEKLPGKPYVMFKVIKK